MNRHYLIFTVLVIGGLLVKPVFAQTYIEPTSPLGGTAAALLNDSATTQRKLGSLIVGSSAAMSYLCLNSDPSMSDPSKDPTCISAWTQLKGNFVTLNDTTPTNPTLLSTYTPTDVGFARVRADAAKNQLFTLILEANGSASQSATALYASDGGVNTNYAAQFNGSVYIGDGSYSSAKKFCLNGQNPIDTNSSSPTYGKGCISSWSDLSAFVPSQNFVLLQSPTQSPIPQNGNIAISGSAIVATSASAGLVIGSPAAGTPVSVTCGDGMCNGLETGNSCPVDCDRTPPGNVNVSEPDVNFGNRSVILGWQNPGDSDFAGVHIIRTIGTPPTGPTMTVGTGADAVFTIPKTATPNSSLTNTGMTAGTLYYYTFYSYDTIGNYASGATTSIQFPGCSGLGC